MSFHRKIQVSMFVLAVLFCMFIESSVFASEKAKPGDVIVVFRNQSQKLALSGKTAFKARELQVKSTVKSMGAEVVKTYSALSESSNNMFVLVHSDTKTEDELLKEFHMRPDVSAVSLNYRTYAAAVTPNDKYYANLWGMQKIGADKLWDKGITGSSEVYVAVIDTGINANHEDLKANFETKKYSRNFTDTDNSYVDGDGHGTHVAGTIGAVGNNKKGVTGVNWKVKIIALKALDDNGEGYVSWRIDALEYLTKLLKANPNLNLASVNISSGGYNTISPTETTTNPEWVAFKAFSDLNRAVICVAAGNDNREVGKDGYWKGYYYPASLRGIKNMIVVGASDSYSTARASYSNYSTKYVDVAAPGTSIRSTIPGDSYGYKDGTSMATPHVAGIAALLKSAFPSATASQIKNAIIKGADTTRARDYTHYGFVNAERAYMFLKGDKLPSIKNKTAINSKNFPDAKFLAYVSENFDTDNNASLSNAEIDNVRKITVGWQNIKSLKGIEFFTALTELRCYYNELTAIDLSKNIALTYLDCDSNHLTKLDVSKNANLQTLRCTYNQLTALDLSKNIALKSLYCYRNKLTKLDLSRNTALTYLSCYGNQMKTLDLSKNARLTSIYIDSQSVPTLTYTKQSNGKYAVNLKSYVSDISRVSDIYVGGWFNESSYNAKTGIILASNAPSYVSYKYNTKRGKMSVTLDKPAKPVILTDSLPNATCGNDYSFSPEVICSKSVNWTLAKGTLPEGLTLSKYGKITGKPKKAGKYPLTLKAYTSEGQSGTKALTLIVLKAPSVSGSLPNAQVKQAYSGELKVSGGTAPYKWAKSSGTLPDGLKINASTGKITGTPSMAGKFTFTVKVTDRNSITAEKKYTVTIKGNSSSSVKKYTETEELLSLPETESEAEPESKDADVITEKEIYSRTVEPDVNVRAAPETHTYFVTELHVMSDDVISQGTGRDSDYVSVRANEPVRFIIGGIVNHESEFKVYINDEHEESIIVSDEGMFTLPAEFVHDDFKVQVKAGELESEELYISAE